MDLNKEAEEAVNNFYNDELLLERIAFKRGYTECAEKSKHVQAKIFEVAHHFYRQGFFEMESDQFDKHYAEYLKELNND
jgi:hypothetical protein